MNLKKILLMCLLLGTLLLICPHKAYAMSTNDQSSTEVGIHILKGDCPPSPSGPTPPSPIIHKTEIISRGMLPKTGELNYYLWSLGGLILLLGSGYLWIRDKKRGESCEKI